jgi:hypothetical protein
MWISQVNIRNRLLHNYICLTVGGVEVVGRSGDVLNGGDPKGASAYPLVEIPMTAVADSTPDPSMG